MKKSILLFLSVVFSVAMMGQSLNSRDRHQKYSGFSLRAPHDDARKLKAVTMTGRPDKLSMPLKSAQLIKQRLDSMIIQFYDEGSSQWYLEVKSNFTYNASGQCISDVLYGYDLVGNQWIPSDQTTYTYNAFHQLVSTESSFWDESSSQWEASYKEDYIYNVNGLLDTNYSYSWDEVQLAWVFSYRYVNIYDANGELLTQVSDYWDSFSSAWESSSKAEYEYNVSGNIVEIKYMSWNSGSSQWEESSKTTYSYNGAGKLTEIVNYVYEEISSQWFYEYKSAYTYNVDGSIASIIDSDWDSGANSWVLGFKSDFVSNTAYTFNDLILPPFVELDEDALLFNFMLTNLTGYGYNSGTWEPEEQFELYYSPFEITAIKENLLEVPHVFPNPVKDNLFVKIETDVENAEFELLDLLGKKIMTQTIFGTSEISMNHLPSGFYFYRITQGSDKVYSGKLMVE